MEKNVRGQYSPDTSATEGERMSEERVLVTGVAGFIGSRIARRLADDGVGVVGVDNFSTGRRENLEDLPRDPALFRLVEGDLCDPAVARAACQGATHILHQATIPSVPRSIKRPFDSLHSSVTATLTLFEAVREMEKRPRIVQAASSSAYGGVAPLPAREDAFPSPRSPYAAAKLAQEFYARAYAASMGLDVVSLRYFNVYGPGQAHDSPYSGVIARFATRMLAGERPLIHGDGSTSRDFTFIDDVVEANLLAMRHPGPELAGEVYNAAGGYRVSLLEVVAGINEILGTEFAPEFGPVREGDVRHSQADPTKARLAFGFAARVPFAEGLRRTVDWYRGRR